MAEKGGKDLLLQIDTGGASYSTLGGLQAKEFTITNEEIDVTNHGSNQFKTLLDGAGIRSMSISGSGICDASSTLDQVDDACLAGTLTSFRIVDNDSGRTYTASFKVTEFSKNGEYNGAMQYSLSLMSSGTITVS